MRRQPAEVAVHDVRPLRARRTRRGSRRAVARASPSAANAIGVRRATSSMTPSTPTTGRRVDRDVAGLVVEADVAAGDRDAELEAAVGEAGDGLRELPHDARVLGRAEVEAVGDRERHRTGGGDVAVGLGQRQLRAGVRVERGEAAVAVGGQRDAEAGLLVDADHAGVLGLREHGVAQHVAVVLVGDPGLGREVRRGDQRSTVSRSSSAVAGRGERVGGVGLPRVQPRGAGERALVDRALVGDGARRHVDDRLAVPLDRRAGRCR